jgi:hypothetical protein
MSLSVAPVLVALVDGIVVMTVGSSDLCHRS